MSYNFTFGIQKNNSMKKRILLPIISLIIISYSSFAQGDLLISPRRVVFEGNKQKEELNLVNIGKDTAIYAISFVQYNMKEDGTFKPIEKPDSGQMFADPYLRVFPRRVTLAPREPQVIALQYRRIPNMQPGEYRSHLYFRSEKNTRPLGSANKGKDTAQLVIDLIPIYGMSIPVIIRSGSVNVTTVLNNLMLEANPDSTYSLKITINRSGNISSFGDLRVEFTPLKGKPYEVGRVNGIGVYTNLKKRNISIKLTKSPLMTFKNGKLKVQYQSVGLPKPVIYSEAELDLSKK